MPRPALQTLKYFRLTEGPGRRMINYIKTLFKSEICVLLCKQISNKLNIKATVSRNYTVPVNTATAGSQLVTCRRWLSSLYQQLLAHSGIPTSADLLVPPVGERHLYRFTQLFSFYYFTNYYYLRLKLRMNDNIGRRAAETRRNKNRSTLMQTGRKLLLFTKSHRSLCFPYNVAVSLRPEN